MPTVDFLPFAVGGAANVEAQAAYAAETALLANGFVSGVAPSAKFNKALRQSSIMSAVLAQFIADLSGQNVIDDGTIATILANFKGSINPGSSLSGNGYQKLPSGLIVQWGGFSASAVADTTVTFPIAFPNAVYSIVGTVGQPLTHVSFVTNSATLTTFNANAVSSGGRNAFSCNWIAVGK